MTKEEQEIHDRAIEFARRNRERIAREVTLIEKYRPDPNPISVFMAGSPGAGKTEFSTNIIVRILEEGGMIDAVRIDPDEFRKEFPEYNGKNSYLFHGAVSLIVEKVHDHVLHNGQTFILDGTFSRYEKAVNNIKRSLKKNRSVHVFYLFQPPEIAWKFTQVREADDGRKITKEMFIEGFLGAIDTVRKVAADFTTREVSVLMIKIKKTHSRLIIDEIVDIRKQHIDNYLPERYTRETLETIL